MQLFNSLTFFFVVFCCFDNVIAQQRALKRQASSDASTTLSLTSNLVSSSTSSPTATPSASLIPSSSPVPLTTKAQSSHSLHNSHRSSLTTSDGSTTKTAHTTSTATVSSNASQTGTLPLQPEITPALGVAGILLILAGLALNVIGIKHKAINIFLSAALLTSLAVVVLIVYLMSPPVNDAIQGAFFVAAFFTGLIFGGVSLIFPEVTEGLGCLLGGFCLAMWFLVLSPGGLLKTTTAKAIMIGAFCIAGWSLSFSRYTRNYGLIVGTSFGGATAAVIGIDCYSRAGLVQFWLYLWNLNDNIFATNTDTYPITRGIRVEIAAIILLSLFGVMSQLKIWKIVQERRKRSDIKRMRDLESRDQNDADVGRKIRAENERDLKRWEEQYGEKQPVVSESGLASSAISLNRRASSVTEKDMDAIEIEGESGEKIRKKSSRSDGILAAVEEVASSPMSPVDSTEQKSSDPLRPSLEGVAKEDSEEDMVDQDGRPAIPQVVPLPFSPPVDDEENVKSDAGSAATKVTVGDPDKAPEQAGISLSTLKNQIAKKQSGELLVEDDRRSSIAATADHESDDGDDRHSERRLSLAVSSIAPAVPEDVLAPLPLDSEKPARPPSYAGSAVAEDPVDENDDEALVVPAAAPVEASAVAQSHTIPERHSTTSSGRKAKSAKVSHSNLSQAYAETEAGSPSIIGSLSEHLPEKLSKVALAYRTNEWAKHIADADQPEADEPPRSSSPGIQIDRAFPEEKAKPVDPAGLVGGLDESPPGDSRRGSKASIVSYQKAREVQSQPARRPSASVAGTAVNPPYVMERSDSQTSIPRRSNEWRTASPTNFSKPQLKMPQRASMASSMTQDRLVESPVEDLTMRSSANFSIPLIASAGNSSMPADRMNRTSRQATGLPLQPSSSTPALNMALPDTASVHSMHLTRSQSALGPLPEHDSDDISLRERQSQTNLHRQFSKPSPQHPEISTSPPPFGDHRVSPFHPAYRQSASPPSAAPPPVRTSHLPTSLSSNTLIHDSHPPRRDNSVAEAHKQAALFNQWRETLAAEVQPTGARPGSSSSAPNILAQQQQWAAFQRQQAAEEQQKRQRAREQAMRRSGHMQGAHQDVLRRMQAKANRSASDAEQG